MNGGTKRVFVTGIGVVSPLGVGFEPFSNALAVGKSVTRRADPVAQPHAPFTVCSQIEGFAPQQLIQPRKQLKLMCREVQTGVAAALLARNHAQLESTEVDATRFGVLFGSEMLYGDPAELGPLFAAAVEADRFEMSRFGQRMETELFPLWMLKYLPNMPACHVAIGQSACGPNNSIVQGDASGLLALAEAATVIQRGWADVMIAGATGQTIQLARAPNLNPQIYSQRSDDPAAAVRPFDRLRDGGAAGEGAAALVLESADHMRRRGGRPLAELTGFGNAFQLAHPYDRNRPNGPSAEAIYRSITLALARAQCTPDDLDHVNAHGLGTRDSDRHEAAAICRAVGDVPVTAPKSFFGNLGAGSSCVELAVTLYAFLQHHVPPTLNFTQPDPDCPVRVIRGEPKRVTAPAALVLSQSSTGQAAAIVVRRID